MEIEFIDRVMKTNLIAGAVASFGVALHYGLTNGLAVLAGSAWGTANLYMIKTLILNAFKPAGFDYLKVLLGMMIKFPFIYLVGYLFLISLPYQGLIFGFSLLFVMVFMLLSRLFFVKQSFSKREVD